MHVSFVKDKKFPRKDKDKHSHSKLSAVGGVRCEVALSLLINEVQNAELMRTI